MELMAEQSGERFRYVTIFLVRLRFGRPALII